VRYEPESAHADAPDAEQPGSPAPGPDSPHGPWQVRPIGYLQTPFPDGFGVPRQPGLVPVPARLHLSGPWAHADAVRALEDFSHLWLLSWFHRSAGRWSRCVRPPRLGGNRRVGVFASRSPYRPNPIGLSVVRLCAIRIEAGRPLLELEGADLIDGTPILDIKPYLPFVDAHGAADCGYAASGFPAALPVRMSPQAEQDLQQLGLEGSDWQHWLWAVLAQDPRPAYHASGGGGDGEAPRTYGLRLGDWHVRFRIAAGVVEVLQIERFKTR